MRIPTDKLVLEFMAARSGTEFIAREIGYMLQQIYGRSASNKSISQIMIQLDDEYPMLNRRETTNQEKALYNCRRVYVYGYFDPETGKVI